MVWFLVTRGMCVCMGFILILERKKQTLHLCGFRGAIWARLLLSVRCGVLCHPVPLCSGRGGSWWQLRPWTHSHVCQFLQGPLLNTSSWLSELEKSEILISYIHLFLLKLGFPALFLVKSMVNNDAQFFPHSHFLQSFLLSVLFFCIEFCVTFLFLFFPKCSEWCLVFYF